MIYKSSDERIALLQDENERLRRELEVKDSSISPAQNLIMQITAENLALGRRVETERAKSRKQAAREAISVTVKLAMKKNKNELAPIEVADAIWAHFGLGEGTR